MSRLIASYSGWSLEVGERSRIWAANGPDRHRVHSQIGAPKSVASSKRSRIPCIGPPSSIIGIPDAPSSAVTQRSQAASVSGPHPSGKSSMRTTIRKGSGPWLSGPTWPCSPHGGHAHDCTSGHLLGQLCRPLGPLISPLGRPPCARLLEGASPDRAVSPAREAHARPRPGSR